MEKSKIFSNLSIGVILNKALPCLILLLSFIRELAVGTRHIVDRKPKRWLFPNFVNNSNQPHHFKNNPVVPVFLPSYFCRLWAQKKTGKRKRLVSSSGPPCQWRWRIVIWILEEMRAITNPDLNISLSAQLAYQNFSSPISPGWLVRSVLTVKICMLLAGGARSNTCVIITFVLPPVRMSVVMSVEQSQPWSQFSNNTLTSIHQTGGGILISWIYLDIWKIFWYFK